VTLRRVLEAYDAAGGGLLASGLAYTALFALVPTSLLVLGLAGYVTNDPAFRAQLVAQLAAAFPPLRDVLDDVLAAVGRGAGLSSIIGAVGLVWAVSQFYVTLDGVFARIFSELPARGFPGRQIRGFLWVALLIGLVVAAVVLGSVASLAARLFPARFATLEVAGTVATSPIGLAVLAIVVVAVAYRVLPPRPPGWRRIAPPAIVVGLVMVVLAQGFSVLAPRLVGNASVVGSLATAFVALAYLSLTFQVFLIGAAWVRVRAVKAADDEPEPIAGLA